LQGHEIDFKRHMLQSDVYTQLSYGCRHLRDAKECLYGDSLEISQICESYDRVRHGQELALDFICDNGHSGRHARLVFQLSASITERR